MSRIARHGVLAANYSGVSGSPACTACLGAWTGEIATTLGGTALDSADTCGHQLSKTAPAAGLYAYGATALVTVNWPSSELRIMAVNTTTPIHSGTHLGALTPALLNSSTNDVFLCGADYDPYDGTGRTRLTPQSLNLAGTVYAAPTYLVDGDLTGVVGLGIAGDGRCWLIANGVAYRCADAAHPDYKLPTNWTATPCVLLSDSMFPGPWTSDISAEAQTDAAILTIIVPDMSADGITSVKDFCGNPLA